MKIHKVKCDVCHVMADLRSNGEHWLTPVDWVQLYDDNTSEVIEFYLCPKCVGELMQKGKENDVRCV